MRLNKNELEFIRLACVLKDGVFDFDSENFEEVYGLTYSEAWDMVEKLKDKCNDEIRKHKKVTQKQST